MVKVYSEKNVFEAIQERLDMVFDDFEDIYVSVSGGKDSTVLFNLALAKARERGRRIGCFFVDQEFEYQATIDMIRYWMHLPDVDPFWLQAPLKMYNANSPTMPYVKIWDESRRDTWMREREPDSMHEPFCESDRFHGQLEAFVDWRQSVTGRKSCGISGMRADESYNRFRGLTNRVCYKDITWGTKNPKGTVTFYPLYDWTYIDIWKYIVDNKLKYNSVYDKQYVLGFPLQNMRISNLIHEYTLRQTKWIQEIEPETYDKLIRAIPGIATTAKFDEDFEPKKLPEAFTSWKEYSYYLLDTIVDPQYREGFRTLWASQADDERIHRMHVTECLRSDVTHTVNKDRTAHVSCDILNSRRKKDGL